MIASKSRRTTNGNNYSFQIEGSRRDGEYVAVLVLCFYGGPGSFFCHEPNSWCAEWVSSNIALIAPLQEEVTP